MLEKTTAFIFVLNINNMRKIFFVNNPLAVEESDEHALQLSPFSVSVSFELSCTAYAFFPERLCNLVQGLRLTFSQICTQFDAVPLSERYRNRIRPVSPLEIKGRKKLALPLSCLKVCTLTRNIC
jgi:hypothetical protein